MALIVVLSVFNGFDELIKSLYNSFDPDIKITVVEGKSFQPSDSILQKLSEIPGVALWSKVIEENALLKHGDRQYIASIKGVDEKYHRINNIDSFVTQGRFTLHDSKSQYAVIGQGVAFYLQVGLQDVKAVEIFLPRKNAAITNNPAEAFNQKYIFPSGFFTIEQECDSKYVIVPIRFMQELTEDTLSVSALEIRLMHDANRDKTQRNIKTLFGNKYKVQNKIQQKEVFYRIMNYEKWAIFFILAFILMIASFNVVGSLSMLIIEKKKDISTLFSLGGNQQLVRRIFLIEGMMISLAGAAIGLILGLLMCWVQIKFGLVKLEGSGSFIIDAYPVSVQAIDIVLVFATVVVIGFLSAWYPVKLITRRYLPEYHNK